MWEGFLAEINRTSKSGEIQINPGFRWFSLSSRIVNDSYHLINAHYILGTIPGSLHMKKGKIVLKNITVATNPTTYCISQGSTRETTSRKYILRDLL